MRRLIIAAGLVLALVGVAAADIRPTPPSDGSIDADNRKLTPRPASPPQAEQGCASRSAMAPEWVFALTALGLGGVALRRFRRPA